MSGTNATNLTEIFLQNADEISRKHAGEIFLQNCSSIHKNSK